MNNSRRSLRSVGIGFALLLLWSTTSPPIFRSTSSAAPPTTRPPDGLRDNSPTVHALVNARIVAAPGKMIERGSIVVRDGQIEAVGENVSVPVDARVWDLTGRTVYPGFIDAYTEAEAEWKSDEHEGGYWNDKVRPQWDIGRHWRVDSDRQKKYREQGITVRLVVPRGGIIKGSSALVTSGEGRTADTVLHSSVAQHLHLTVPPGTDRNRYPNSPMGAVALARQAFYDAQWYQQAHAFYAAGRQAARPEYNAALEVLARYLNSDQLVIAETSNELFCLRADQFAREFALRLILKGSGNEYRRLDAIQRTGRAVIVPLSFPKPPNVTTPEAARNASLEDLMHWDHAPENPARLAAAGIPMAFTSAGLKELDEFLPALRRAVKRGLSPTAALEALTTTPAAWFGVAGHIGTIDAGKAAHLVVTSGDVFEEKTKVLETWVDGRRYQADALSEHDGRGTWELTIDVQGAPTTVQLVIRGESDDLEGKLLVPGQGETPQREIKFDEIGRHDVRLSGTFPSESFGFAGKAQLSAVLSLTDSGAATALGQIAWPTGMRVSFEARRTQPHREGEDEEANKSDDEDDEEDDREDDDERDSDKEEENDDDDEDERKQDLPSSFPINYPLGAFGRTALPEASPQVLLTGATIWTSGPAGIFTEASLLIRDGKIVAVGRDLETPAGAVVMDMRGKHITPGIIDCHSHMATDGGVNESGQAITAEVRIGDFIDADDINIYRQLAGGVTTSNILHGSANPIGGQNQVIKLRWGMLPEELKFADAPAGIKFALGENVKQSNWGDEFTTRYPQTRMGVEQLMRDELLAARQYADRWQQWNATQQGAPPRRDLELEAMVEVLHEKRWIHCHSYRQDEILALLRTLDDFQITVGSLQHILEGYKVADEMARHGATGSSFADWWAYKFEVYDAIPYNGALLHRAGVVVSFNSDDRELARHLNHEAAKAMKYGGVPAIEALKFVTLNPARQLRIDHLVGSLEPGKHADFVVWNGEPLSTLSRCEQTWVDGRRFFDRAEDQHLREAARAIRTTLVQKILASGEKPRSADDEQRDPAEFWPRDDLFCHPHHHHGHDEH